MSKLIATISTSPSTAGLWVNDHLYGAIRREGGEVYDEKDSGNLLMRVKCVDETGITIDAFQGDTVLKYNFQDKKHPERFAKGRLKSEWNDEIRKYGGLYHPFAVEVERIDYGVFLIPHPVIERLASTNYDDTQ